MHPGEIEDGLRCRMRAACKGQNENSGGEFFKVADENFNVQAGSLAGGGFPCRGVFFWQRIFFACRWVFFYL